MRYDLAWAAPLKRRSVRQTHMKIIESVILAVLLLNCDGFVGEIKVDAQDTASSAGKWYRLPTTSMEPTIRKEDQILVDEAAYETRLRRGEISSLIGCRRIQRQLS